MKYNVGDQVTNKTTHPGQTGIVVEINPQKRCQYRVAFPGRPAIWHPEIELSAVAAAHRDETMDIESGIGIGGAGSDDFNIHTERDTMTAHKQYKCAGGQRYDEACAGCGRITVICNDCELCERCHDEE